jgi:hypothetical protein
MFEAHQSGTSRATSNRHDENSNYSQHRAGALPQRDVHGRFIARPGTAPKVPRVRVLPPRNARGRFASFPMTSAPSWYVPSADSHRIPSVVDVLRRLPSGQRRTP